ncbi:MAG: UDP-N-acetylmuramoyl-L-alanyl-D-glutamate--2,6-diaminopimelate ligase [Candidatus Spyradocola sp.]|nr:UDP-N-acetylmuramoyl-L-alanyl-D-glutamate--2,6-diaminopimelate ligase [Candidatus Spyradocola sp.]
MKLTELANSLPTPAQVYGQAEVTGLTCDSRKVSPGDLYFCLPGLRVDGHSFAQQAADKGAAALVVERKLPVELPQVLVEDARAAMSYMAQCFYGYPARGMRGVGITGTKGKTTTSFLVREIARHAGYKVGLMGTVCTSIGDKEEPASLTTPDPIDVQSLLARMRDAGCDFYVMEVSAHALDLRKLVGMQFDQGVFTNFSQDHLDYFGTMETYRKAKEKFFTPFYLKHAVVNADDEAAPHMLGKVETTTFGVSKPADAYANDIEIHESGVSFVLSWKDVRIPLHLHISGIFNVYNSMAAAVACLEMGMDPEKVKEGLEAVTVVPGRIEPLPTHTPYRVILDYAHSPASLESILKTIREFTRGRLICLFGCGGGRDKEKRPIMGEISGRLADFSILTSDNPRLEQPMDILSAIEAGIKPTGAPYVVIENRREAIRYAMQMGQPGDVIVLAGKGHETYQDIGGQKLPFDEKVVVRELLREMGGSPE